MILDHLWRLKTRPITTALKAEPLRESTNWVRTVRASSSSRLPRNADSARNRCCDYGSYGYVESTLDLLSLNLRSSVLNHTKSVIHRELLRIGTSSRPLAAADIFAQRVNKSRVVPQVFVCVDRIDAVIEQTRARQFDVGTPERIAHLNQLLYSLAVWFVFVGRGNQSSQRVGASFSARNA